MWNPEPTNFSLLYLHFASCNISHQSLENIALLSYEDLPNVDTFHYTLQKNITPANNHY